MIPARQFDETQPFDGAQDGRLRLIRLLEEIEIAIDAFRLQVITNRIFYQQRAIERRRKCIEMAIANRKP